MSLSFEKKQSVVSEVSQKFSVANAAILADYRGLTVAQDFRIAPSSPYQWGRGACCKEHASSS